MMSIDAQLLALLGLFAAVAGLEVLAPARPLGGPLARRWVGNMALEFLHSGFLFLPGIAVSLATIQGWGAQTGLLSLVDLPAGARVVVAILAIDAALYWYHRFLHRTAPLWRLHAVHHSDPDMDVSSVLRHHPLEALLTGTYLALVVAAFGFSAFELAAYAWTLRLVQFPAHANIVLPDRWFRLVSSVVVTPNCHAVHHSRHQPETDSNFGDLFTIWDRLFGTRTEPAPGRHPVAAFGLDEFRTPADQSPHRLLLQPFLPRPAAASQAADRQTAASQAART